jgi:hypothetical protein
MVLNYQYRSSAIAQSEDISGSYVRQDPMSNAPQRYRNKVVDHADEALSIDQRGPHGERSLAMTDNL